MKLTGLFLLAGVLAVFPKEVPQSAAQSDETVCFKKERTLDLTILQGPDGKDGLPGLKGDSGEMGQKGDIGKKGRTGILGLKGLPGTKGLKGDEGHYGEPGEPGEDGNDRLPGQKGEPGEDGNDRLPGQKGDKGDHGYKGQKGQKALYGGETGIDGEDGETGRHASPPYMQNVKDLLIHALNDYQVTQSGYYNELYHVRARDLTDGQASTGGWGSETALKAGAYIQATFLRPVYVATATLAGGSIPSWGSTGERNGRVKLEYSNDNRNWTTTVVFLCCFPRMMTVYLSQPVTAQYWRLTSIEEKWVGTTEFALKPLMKI